RFTVNQVYETDTAIIADVYWRLTYGGLLEPKEGNVEIHFDPADHLKIILQRKDLYYGATIIGHNGTISAVYSMLFTQCNFTVTDLDKVGATFVTIRVRHVGLGGSPVRFDGNVTLTETPPRSGTFMGSRTSIVTGGDTITATYIDEITSDWRRNIRRSSTYTAP
ncbi:MAG: hypothetical protein MUO24_12205, partial [Desulfobacterales bacterium]|nr:hypothetical protein [Desulfobacterales bacterium]